MAQLSLWIVRKRTNGSVEENRRHAEHVRRLWRMAKKDRLHLWRFLRPRFTNLVKLALGGDADCVCPLDDEELGVLFVGGGQEPLKGLRELFLYRMGSLTDSGFGALTHAGCGKNLTWLSLSCAHRFPSTVAILILMGSC